MKTWMKASVCIALSLMFCFLSVGYAVLTDTLTISGTVKVEIPYGLFITTVTTKEDETSNVDKNEAEHLQYTTTLDSTISRSWNGSGTVTYEITVLNNTRLTYSYRGLYYQTNLDGYNGNSYVSTSNGNNRIGVVCSLASASTEEKKVSPGETLTFEVTYTVGKNMSSSTDWSTLINFQFGINVDGEAEAIEIVEEKFLNILNTTSTYEELIDVLDNKYDGTYWKSNYIGNVKGSTDDDSMAVNTLFAGQLQITVGDEQMDATVLIKHENIDGNEDTGDDYTAVYGNQSYSGYGCEMTLYLTIDPLAKEDMNQYVPVYAVVFTCDQDENGNPTGDWYRIGDTYYGEANVVDYDGGTDGDGGSFVTDNWNARQQTYTVVDGYSYTIGDTVYSLDAYSYTVAENLSIENVLMAYDDNATAALQTLLDHAKAIIDSKEYAGTGITLVEDAYAAASAYYTVDADGNPIANSGIIRAKLCSAISDLYYAVDEALLRIEALTNQQN